MLALLIGWIATYLPLVWWRGGAAFTSNVYDLAEWMSLIPRVRYGDPALVLPGLLRIIPGLFAVAIALESAGFASRWPRRALRLLAVLIAIGLMPPIDFFRGQFADPNYRQQMIIAIVTAIGVGLAIRFPIRLIALPCVALAGACAIIGYNLSNAEFIGLRTGILVGAGLPVIIGAGLVYGVLAFDAFRRDDAIR